MTKLILNTECNMYERKGQALCSSRQIADSFKKRHADILRTIYDKIESSIGDDLATQFCTANFIESKYKDRGKSYPEFLMTRSGFSYIAMGLTGKKADRFKIIYINRFEQMEKFILSLNTSRVEYPALTAAISDAHEVPKHYHFSNEADMINRIVVGVSAKDFRKEKGIDKGESIRSHLSLEQIQAIEALQRIDVGLLVAAIEYEERKRILTQYYDRMQIKQIAA